MIDVAVTSLLRDAAGIGNRIYPSTETVVVVRDLPKIVYTQIDLIRRYTDDGNIGLTQARYQIDIFADYPAAARTIADNIRIGLDGFRGQQDTTRILRIYFDSERFDKGDRAEGQNNTVTRFIQEMIVEYREAIS